MSRVLVTGASGFIGSRALGLLAARGHEVHAVARRGGDDDGGRVNWHRTDLLDDVARASLVADVRPSHLLHLAWYATPGEFWTAAENALWVSATVRLMGEFAAAGGRRAVLAGTCAEYAWGAPGVLREDAPRAPATFYGACKGATREVVEGLGALHDVEVAWGRVFFLYGPGEPDGRLVSGVARALVSGARAPTSAGDQVRDFLHVDDVAGAFAMLVDAEATGPVNIGSGAGVTVRRVVELIAEAAGAPDLLDIGALPARADDPPVVVADIGRLRDEVGFQQRIALEAGIEDAVRWWRER